MFRGEGFSVHGPGKQRVRIARHFQRKASSKRLYPARLHFSLVRTHEEDFTGLWPDPSVLKKRGEGDASEVSGANGSIGPRRPFGSRDHEGAAVPRALQGYRQRPLGTSLQIVQ